VKEAPTKVGAFFLENFKFVNSDFDIINTAHLP